VHVWGRCMWTPFSAGNLSLLQRIPLVTFEGNFHAQDRLLKASSSVEPDAELTKSRIRGQPAVRSAMLAVGKINVPLVGGESENDSDRRGSCVSTEVHSYYCWRDLDLADPTLRERSQLVRLFQTNITPLTSAGQGVRAVSLLRSKALAFWSCGCAIIVSTANYCSVP